MTDDELLDAIQAIRAKNNSLHIGIQRLAFEVAPERARALLRQIVDYDAQIGVLSRQLARGPAPSTKNCPDQRPGCHISDYHVH